MSNGGDSFATFREYYSQYRRRYWMLGSRDRMLVNVGALVVVAALLFLVVINPALKMRAQAEMELDARRSLLQWVKDNEPRAAQAAKSGVKTSAASGQSLMAAVTSSAGRVGVQLKRYEPEGDDKLRVWLEDQSFNKTIRWIDTLQKQNGMSVVNISIDASRQPGLVTAKIVLRG